MNVLFFLVKTLTDLYLLVFVLRLLLQIVRADFYNPFCQFVVRATNPLVRPARRLIPSVGAIDMATVLVLVALEIGFTYLLVAVAGFSAPPMQMLIWAFLRLIALVVWAYTLSIFVYVILSFISQGNYNPVGAIAAQIAEPIVRPFRRIIPVMGGFDLSPMIALILLYAASIALTDLGLPALLR